MHTDTERIIRGTWCTPELVKAVQMGYIIKQIHEVWNFPPNQRPSGLFKGYVDTWLKTQQESLGWPSGCNTIEEKRNYILNYKEKEGIKLEINKIAKNPGRKATAKLMLNWYLFHFFFFHVVILPLLMISFVFLQFMGEIWRKTQQVNNCYYP